MSDTTITLDLSGDYPAQNAAHIYLRARTGDPGPMSPRSLAKRVNEVAAESSDVSSVTRGFDSNDRLVQHVADARHEGDRSRVTLQEFEDYVRGTGYTPAAILFTRIPDEEKAKARA